MRPAILGTGNVAPTLARRWSAAGHEITLGSMDPASKHAWTRCCSTRTDNPMSQLEDGSRYTVFASTAGADGNPGCYHNLKASPDRDRRSDAHAHAHAERRTQARHDR